ncbi:MAG: type II toxin-antitoxin system VapC family toxin [Alphaproteobacteria bacterium]
MSLVIDASITLSWYFEDEQTPASLDILRDASVNGAIVPSLWRLEVASAFQSALRRKRITVEFRDLSLRDLETLAISIDAETDRHAWARTLRFADRFGLTVYDASYLELADRLGIPLATGDASLAHAAASCDIPVRGP